MNEFTNLLGDENDYHQFQAKEISEKQMQFESECGQNVPLCPTTNANDDIPLHCQVQISPNCPNNVDFPFVRIHAFDIPISNNINPVYNSNNPLPITSTNNREIKPKIEPIKSELNDVNNIIGGNSNESSQQERSSNTLIPDSPSNSIAKVLSCREEIKVLQCEQCMFLTISRINLDNHFSTTHENLIQINNDNIPRSKLFCPGCDNYFYSQISLSSHLKHDHFMMESEITKLSEFRASRNENSSNKKNRIYLKNVECLREHPSQSINSPFLPTLSEESPNSNNFSDDVENDFEPDLNFIDLINEDNFSYTENDEIMIEKLQSFPPPKVCKPLQKQKAIIKSGKNVREPLYLQHVQNSINNEKFTEPSFNLTAGNNIFYDLNTNYSDRIQDSTVRNTDIHSEMEQKSTQRAAPKIYIKNVDILKEPIFLPPTNISNILNVNETLHFNNFPSRNISIPEPPSPHILGTACTIDNNHNNIVETIENRLFDNDQSNIEYNISNNQKKNNKYKIYIKNVDILKQPEHQASPTKKFTNFLHLRTVDELNLMNKNQINLMNNLQHQNIQNNSNYQPEILYTSLANSKNSDNNSIYNNYEIPRDGEYISANDENVLIHNNSNYGFVNLGNISTSSIGEQKSYQFHPQYDLNTPQLAIDERTVSENEREMLLVCAEELILNQEKDTNYLVSNESFENICKRNFNELEDKMANKKDAEKEINESVDDLKKQINKGNVVEIFDDPSCDENLLNPNLNNSHDEGCISASEKGRIYVSENLMDDKMVSQVVYETPTEDALLNKTKRRAKGRPFGAKTSRAIKSNELDVNNSHNTNYKCDFMDCAIRFKMLTTLEYHKKCHKSIALHTSMQCPECFSDKFSNWNTLHTHLWRHHNIDMELYNCQLCNFKTPILSRLYNTHMKIHSNERNFKCDQCEKAFKNSKQLKNHRRLHRTWKKPLELHKCEMCLSVFSNTKTRKEHFCQQSSQQAIPHQNLISSKCKICDKLCSSKSSLKLHTLTHQESCKFKCNNCDYITNDHNAFRRHRSTHDKIMMYDCPYCDYKCIQSILYKKHLTTKHPDLASNIIHKCNFCQFTTINQTQFQVHLAKHDNENFVTLELPDSNSGNYLLEDDLEAINLDEFGNKSVTLPMEALQKNKIKVKSDLVLTDPTKFLLQTSNDCVT